MARDAMAAAIFIATCCRICWRRRRQRRKIHRRPTQMSLQPRLYRRLCRHRCGLPRRIAEAPLSARTLTRRCAPTDVAGFYHLLSPRREITQFRNFSRHAHACCLIMRTGRLSARQPRWLASRIIAAPHARRSSPQTSMMMMAVTRGMPSASEVDVELGATAHYYFIFDATASTLVEHNRLRAHYCGLRGQYAVYYLGDD